MLPLWRVARNRVGKRHHARRDNLGVTVSRRYEYRAPILESDEATTPAAVSIEAVEPAVLPPEAPVGERIDAEALLTARTEGEVGRTPSVAVVYAGDSAAAARPLAALTALAVVVLLTGVVYGVRASRTPASG